MYPTANERIAIDEAEKLMVETMAKYDPSHDAYHGGHSSSAYALIDCAQTSYHSSARQKDSYEHRKRSPCKARPSNRGIGFVIECSSIDRWC